MRFTVLLQVLILGFGALLILQDLHAQAQPGGQQGTGQRQPGMGRRGGQYAQPGQPPVPGQGTPPVRPVQTATPETQPVPPAQPPTRPAQLPGRPGQQGASPRQSQSQPQPLPQQQFVRPFGEASPLATPTAGFGQPGVAAPLGSPGTRNANAANAARQQRDVQVAQQAAVQAARQANIVKLSGAYDHIPPAVRNNATFSWFFDCDKDQDGQITMKEYVDGLYSGTWTDAVVNEFNFLDRNGDGVITVDEALTSIREEDEKKAKEAREQQAAAGPQGRPQQGQQPTAGRRSSQSREPGARPSGANPNQFRQSPSGRGQRDQQNLGVPGGRNREGSQ